MMRPSRVACLAFPALILALLLCCSSRASSSQEESGTGIWELWKTKEKAEHRMLIHEARLRSSKPELWLSVDVQAYLTQALWVVDYAYMLYAAEHGILPTSPELLVEDGYISTWPANPCREWHPMRMLNLEDGFSPGDLCLQICPEQYYSQLATGDIGPYSYEMLVYAQDVKQAAMGNAVLIPQNEPWAVIPNEALYMVGRYRETAKVEKSAEQLEHPTTAAED